MTLSCNKQVCLMSLGFKQYFSEVQGFFSCYNFNVLWKACFNNYFFEQWHSNKVA